MEAKEGWPWRAQAAEAHLGSCFGVLLPCKQQKGVRLRKVQSFAGPRSPAGEGVGNTQ